MRLAVSQGVSQLAPDPENKESLRAWLQKEARDLFLQLRRGMNALNPEPISPPVVSDGAGTYSVLWTSGEMPQDAVWTVVADINGTSATVRASYQLRGAFASVAGVCSQIFPTAFDHLYESAAACDARFTVDTTNRVITVDARDDAVVAMTWTGTVYTPAEVVVE